MTPKQQYDTLELRLHEEDLSKVEIEEILNRMDDLWSAMTEDEQDEVDRKSHIERATD